MKGAEGLPNYDNILEALLHSLLKPDKITTQTALRALKKARRTGALWRALTSMERALLTAAANARVKEYKSPKLKTLLARIIAKVESYTPKGMVLAAGLRRVLSLNLNVLLLSQPFSQVTIMLKRKLSYLLYLGRAFLQVADYYVAWRNTL